MPSNELYLAVLPLIHTSSGLVEQTLTLFPDRNFATGFYPNEVESYMLLFQARASKYLVGGHVTGYECLKEETGDGRVIVRVVQNVS